MVRLVSGFCGILGIAHGPRSLEPPVVPICLVVQHESMNQYVTQDSSRGVLFSSVQNS